MVICFYKKTDAYWEFSNFAKYGFRIDDKFYFCVESYYQSQKFIHVSEYMQLIQQADTPMKCKLLGTQSKNYRFAHSWVINKSTNKQLVFSAIDQSIQQNIHVRPDWDSVKISIMLNALRAKFSQNIILKTLLLQTGNYTIIENSPKDYFWGIGKNKTGSNILGKLLMQVREELRSTREDKIEF